MTELIDRYGEALEVLLKDIFEQRPRYIVALARKGPRLLDLCQLTSLAKYLDPSKLLSDRSLAFLQPDQIKNATVCILDDIAIYGSSLKYVTGVVTRLGGTPLPYALAINRDQINTDLVSPKYALGLNFVQASTFNNLLARAIGTLCKPFDTDHPIATLQLKRPQGDVLRDLRSLNQYGARVREIGEDCSSNGYGVKKIVVDLPPELSDSSMLNPASTTASGISKIRFYITQSRICVVPMFLFEWQPTNGMPFSDSSPSIALQLWRELKTFMVDSTFVSPDDTLDWKSYRLYAVAHYVAALACLARVWESLGLTSTLGSSLRDLEWDQSDLQYSFGPVLSEKMVSTIRHFLSDSLKDEASGTVAALAAWNNSWSNGSSLSLESNALYKDIRSGLDGTSFSNKTPCEAISEIFNLTYLHHERKERRLRIDRERRLSVGFSPEEIKAMLKSKSVAFTDSDISAAIDTLVDSGSIVPVFVDTQVPASCWRRVYRYGENGFGTSSIKTQYLIAFIVDEIKRQLPRYSKTRKKVSEFLLEKVSASLLLSNLRRKADISACALKWTVDEFGARVLPTQSVHKETLLRFGVNIGLFAESTPGGDPEIKISAEWRRRFPPENCPLDHRDLLPEISGFIQAVLAFVSSESTKLHSGVHDERLLALSTCGKQEHAIEAIAVIPKLWFFHNVYNADRLFVLWDKLQHSGSPQSAEQNLSSQISKILVSLAQYCRQAENKAQVFKFVRHIREDLSQTFFADRARFYALAPFATKYLDAMVNPELSPFNRDTMGRLYWFCSILRMFTNYLRTLFSESGLIPDDRPADEKKSLLQVWGDLSTLVESVNQRYPEMRITLPLLPKEGSPPNKSSAFDLEYLEHAEGIFREIKFRYEGYVGSLQVAQIKTPVTNEAVLLYDLKKSSDYRQAERIQLLTTIQEKLQKSNIGSHLKFDRSDDDGSWLRGSSIQEVVFAAFRLSQFAAEESVTLRIAISTTKETTPFVDTENTSSGWSPAISLCARMLEYSKTNLPQTGVGSLCVVTEYARDQFQEISGLIANDRFSSVGRLHPRGETLPPVNVFELKVFDSSDSFPF